MVAWIRRHRLTLIAGLAVLIGLPLLGVAFDSFTIPVLSLPKPSGPSPVGTTLAVLGPNTPVQLWYPAQPDGSGRRAPYRLAKTFAPRRFKIVGSLVRTDAIVDARVADGRHPILLYAAAWGGNRADNTAYAQTLASHGFIVVAMDDYEPTRSMDFSSLAAYNGTRAWGAEKVDRQTRIARAIISSLEDVNHAAANRFADHLDLDRIGMFGYSFGGAVAAQVARSDARVKAAANLDGWLFGDALEGGVNKPFLFISCDAPGDTAFAARVDAAREPDRYYTAELDRINDRKIVAGFERHGGFWLTIDGTTHASFSDAALLPISHDCAVPLSTCWAAQRIAAGYLVDFFSRYLNGRPDDLRVDPIAGMNAHVAHWTAPA